MEQKLHFFTQDKRRALVYSRLTPLQREMTIFPPLPPIFYVNNLQSVLHSIVRCLLQQWQTVLQADRNAPTVSMVQLHTNYVLGEELKTKTRRLICFLLPPTFIPIFPARLQSTYFHFMIYVVRQCPNAIFKHALPHCRALSVYKGSWYVTNQTKSFTTISQWSPGTLTSLRDAIGVLIQVQYFIWPISFAK